jgi:hypothetical protein
MYNEEQFMEKEIKEMSTVSPARRPFQYVALALIVLDFVYEGYRTFGLYEFSLLGWGYAVLFLALWLWRCAFQYSYALTDRSFTVIMFGLGIERRMTIPFADMESFSNHYKKRFFRKTKVSMYTYRYSSLDGNPVRILVYRHGTKLRGLLFKCSDTMIDELRRRYPDRFIDLTS